ncbi:hypothetical protein EVAR_30454_1 [Eumeta japonica]|uniref:Uncharacterized protein n=1 Tax=Eumeta variegata TaxID=151549 RepID=A0A4C1W083_EUMVA|nr:hypothetical protein EVAR_30454_1 [Eumeta japonica]
MHFAYFTNKSSSGLLQPFTPAGAGMNLWLGPGFHLVGETLPPRVARAGDRCLILLDSLNISTGRSSRAAWLFCTIWPTWGIMGSRRSMCTPRYRTQDFHSTS